MPAEKINFTKEVLEKSGVNFNRCYQCKTCSSSCPFASEMDYLPHRLIRKVQLEEMNEVLESKTIWFCASCETCHTRCPNQIDIPGLMDTLRIMALQRRSKHSNEKIPVFHRSFMAGIKRWGRQYELGMLLSYKIKTGDLNDLVLGIKMLLKGKLALLPHRKSSS